MKNSILKLSLLFALSAFSAKAQVAYSELVFGYDMGVSPYAYYPTPPSAASVYVDGVSVWNPTTHERQWLQTGAGLLNDYIGGTFKVDTSYVATQGDVSAIYSAISGISLTPGSTGAAGAKGDKGDTGNTGATGAAGSNGTNGTNGTNGAKGDKGDTGTTGATGAAGSNGTNATTTSNATTSVAGLESAMDKTKLDALKLIQDVRVQTDASGNYTWTYPVSYGSGVIPVISVLAEGGTTIPLNAQIVGVPTNTSVTIKILSLPSTTVLGITVIGVPSGAQAYIHITAVAP